MSFRISVSETNDFGFTPRVCDQEYLVSLPYTQRRGRGGNIRHLGSVVSSRYTPYRSNLQVYNPSVFLYYLKVVNNCRLDFEPTSFSGSSSLITFFVVSVSETPSLLWHVNCLLFPPVSKNSFHISYEIKINKN